MAKEMGYSFSYLAQLERGIKKMLSEMYQKHSDYFELDEKMKIELANAIDISNQYISVNLNELDDNKKKIMLLLSRKLEELVKMLF